MNRTSLTIPALAAVAALGLTGCVEAGRSSSPAAADGTTSSSACPWEADGSIETSVRMGYQVIPTGDLIIKDQQVLEACMPNADITWQQYASGGDVVQAFGSDSVDLGLVGSSPTVKALSAPLDLPVSVVWIQDNIGEAEALVAKDASDVAGLAGARIGVPFSSTAHFSLLAALRDAGLDPSTDVQVINLAPDAIVGAWQGDQIDAAYIWDPALTAIGEDGTTLVTGKDVSAAGAPTFDFSVASDAFIEAEPEFMEQWTRAQDWAVAMIQDDPAAAAESLAVEMGTDVDVLQGQLAGTTYLTASEQQDQYFSGALGPVLEQTAVFLNEEGEVAGVSAADHYTGALYTDAISTVAGER